VNHKHEDKEDNTDPVCGMAVTKEEAACSHDYKGKTYYFCAASCRDEFAAGPEEYLRRRNL